MLQTAIIELRSQIKINVGTSVVGRLQQLESTMASALMLQPGFEKAAAEMVIRMVVEDEYLERSAGINAAAALVGYLNSFTMDEQEAVRMTSGVTTEYLHNCDENMKARYRGVVYCTDHRTKIVFGHTYPGSFDDTKVCVDLPTHFNSTNGRIFNAEIDKQLQYGVGLMLAKPSAGRTSYDANIGPRRQKVTFEARHETVANYPTQFVVVSTKASTTDGASLARCVQRDSYFVFGEEKEEGPAYVQCSDVFCFQKVLVLEDASRIPTLPGLKPTCVIR
jgi:hypothetical protein